MKSTLASMLGTAAVASAQWYGGAPDCAHDCLESAWATATSWPAPSDFCPNSDGKTNEVAKCLESACTATPTAWSSYSSLSSSLCSQYAKCTEAGSTGVYTVTAPGYTGTGDWGGKPSHPYGPPGGWSGSPTWSGGVYAVTGCEWQGSPWAGGPDKGGYGPWGQWGNAWHWTTTTVTATVGTVSGSEITAPATVAVAVSGEVSSTTTLGIFGASVKNGANSNVAARSGPGSGGGSLAVKVAGAALAVVLAGVALL